MPAFCIRKVPKFKSLIKFQIYKLYCTSILSIFSNRFNFSLLIARDAYDSLFRYCTTSLFTSLSRLFRFCFLSFFFFSVEITSTGHRSLECRKCFLLITCVLSNSSRGVISQAFCNRNSSVMGSGSFSLRRKTTFELFT